MSTTSHATGAMSTAANVIAPSTIRCGSARNRRKKTVARSRATVFFRLFLALPHLIVLGAMTFAAVLMAPVAWLVVLIQGGLPPALHDFYARVVRYSVHVNAYL